MDDRPHRAGEAIAAAVLVATLAAVAALRPRHAPAAPARIPAAEAEPWMADALPGVGAKRRVAVADALRRGDLRALPRQAREAAAQLFSGLDAAAGGR